MARETGVKHNRLNIEYWAGINSSVSYRLAKRSEPAHMENARAPIIGVLEKRQGQAKMGTKPNGTPFTSAANYGLVNFQNEGDNQQVFRVSEMAAVVPPFSAILLVSLGEDVLSDDAYFTNHPDTNVIHSVTPWTMTGHAAKTFRAGAYSFTDSGFTNISNVGLIPDGSYAVGFDLPGAPAAVSIDLIGGSVPEGTITGFTCSVTAKADPFVANQPANVYFYNRSYTNSLHGAYTGDFLLAEDSSLVFHNTGFTTVTVGSSTSIPGGGDVSLWHSSDFRYGADRFGAFKYFYPVVTLPGNGNSKELDLDAVNVTIYYKTIFPYEINYFSDTVSVVDPPLMGKAIGDIIYIYPVRDEGLTNIYSLSNTNHWDILEDFDAQALVGAPCDFTAFEGNLAIVNGVDLNRYISKDGTTITTSDDTGHLFNSPISHKATFYKNRLYLADFVHDTVRYPTTVVRSSYPLGIVALANADAGAGTLVVPVTDTKYFYADPGMNEYDVLRGGFLVGTMQVSSIRETSVTVISKPFAILASDEIWISGTYNGEKQYRWQSNPSTVGRDVKQYDTMKLSGGDEDPITLLETVGNILMVGNKNTLMSWNDYNFENFDLRVGSVSQNGYIKFLGSLYFLHYTGIYSTTGSAPTLLSRKIDRYIHGATKAGLEASAAGYKGLSVFFTLGDVTLYNDDGSLWKVLPDVVAEYHTGNQDWYIHTNIPASEFETFVDSTGAERLLMQHEDTGKFVKEFLTGTTDDGEEIFFRVDTQILPLMAEFEWFLNPVSVVVETDRGTFMKCFISPDEDKDFYELPGTISKGVTILKANSPSEGTVEPVLGRHVRLSFRDASTQLCRLMQVSLLFIPTMMDYTE